MFEYHLNFSLICLIKIPGLYQGIFHLFAASNHFFFQKSFPPDLSDFQGRGNNLSVNITILDGSSLIILSNRLTQLVFWIFPCGFFLFSLVLYIFQDMVELILEVLFDSSSAKTLSFFWPRVLSWFFQFWFLFLIEEMLRVSKTCEGGLVSLSGSLGRLPVEKYIWANNAWGELSTGRQRHHGRHLKQGVVHTYPRNGVVCTCPRSGVVHTYPRSL